MMHNDWMEIHAYFFKNAKTERKTRQNKNPRGVMESLNLNPDASPYIYTGV